MTDRSSTEHRDNQNPDFKESGLSDVGPSGKAIYLSVIEELPAYVACKDLHGRYTVVSEKFARMLDLAPAAVVGKTDFEFYPQHVAERFATDDNRVIETGELLVDAKKLGEGNEQRYFELRKGPIHDKQGQIVGVHTVFWDVTEQKRAEQSLQRERDMLQTIMDNLPDFIYVKDNDGHYVVINDAVRQVLGAQSTEEVIGKSNNDFLPTDQANLERADDDHVISTASPLIEREERMLDQHGNELWLLTSKLPLMDSSGTVTGLVGIDRDITHLKQTERELRSAKESADHANRAKGDFLANMSHEIRTPMNAIIGMTDLLLETQLTKTQREYLNMVQDSGDALLTLINDILDFSKIEAGKLELETTSFDIRESLGDTMKSLGLRAYAKGIELAVHVDNSLPRFLIGDAGRIRQVIVNLIGNAIKFTEQGEVVLEILCPSLTESQATVHFKITDTGIGIEPEKCDRVFEEFEQADASTTRRFGGTGLGLAISSRLVALMDGKIWVESAPGQGSTFQFTVTLDIDHSQHVPVRTEQLVVVNGLRVMVVDDNATNRRILKDMLTNWGMAPVTASGAAQAVGSLRDAKAEDDPIRIVISDVNMPESDGISLARQIIDEQLIESTSVIMLTSGARPDDVTQLRELGVSQHLMKPIKQSELFGAIVNSLDAQENLNMNSSITTIQETVANPVRALHILLAEDNTVNQKLALGILGRLGHKVTVANNGLQAIRELETGHFDLVLMDVQMPEMDGLSATREIRKRESTGERRIPIVAMTAHAMKGDREECLESGMDEYLTKPIRLQDMSNKLQELFCDDIPGNTTATTYDARSTETQDMTDPTVICWDDALKNVGGDRQLMDEVIQAFVQETPLLMKAAERSANDGNLSGLQAAAHSLKGSLLFLNIRGPYTSIEQVESSCDNGDLDRAREELTIFKLQLHDVQIQLESYLKS